MNIQASATPATHTLGELAKFIGAELKGDATCVIESLATLAAAESGQLSFLANKSYRKYLKECRASALILHPDMAAEFSGNALLVDNPYLAYAKLSALFDQSPKSAAGIHPSATVAEDAIVHADASVGPQVVIESGARVEAGAVIGAGSFIGAGSIIGERTVLKSNVSIYHGCFVGSDCLFHSQAVIGSDGFGFAPNTENDDFTWTKIHQLGGVVIGDRVELGACTAIDRGALDDTVLADGVIIDNQVQIAHNVRIGENTAIASSCAIAGSTTIGSGCTFSGMVGVVGHLTITDNVHVTAMTLVTKSIDKPGSYSAGTPVEETAKWRKNAVRFGQLNALVNRVRSLEKHSTDSSKK